MPSSKPVRPPLDVNHEQVASASTGRQQGREHDSRTTACPSWTAAANPATDTGARARWTPVTRVRLIRRKFDPRRRRAPIGRSRSAAVGYQPRMRTRTCRYADGHCCASGLLSDGRDIVRPPPAESLRIRTLPHEDALVHTSHPHTKKESTSTDLPLTRSLEEEAVEVPTLARRFDVLSSLLVRPHTRYARVAGACYCGRSPIRAPAACRNPRRELRRTPRRTRRRMHAKTPPPQSHPCVATRGRYGRRPS